MQRKDQPAPPKKLKLKQDLDTGNFEKPQLMLRDLQECCAHVQGYVHAQERPRKGEHPSHSHLALRNCASNTGKVFKETF